MRVAAIDIGTNTVLSLIADISNSEIKSIHSESLHSVRLGEGVDKTGEFSGAALLRLESSLSEITQTFKDFGVVDYVAVATSASRDVKNRNEFEAILAKFGIRAQVISGDEEALYTFRGAFEKVPQELSGVIDVGGGSTEITVGTDQKILFKKSFNLGSVRLTERCITRHPVSLDEMSSLRAFISEMVKPLTDLVKDLDHRAKRLVAVAGTPTQLAGLILKEPFDREKVDGFQLSIEQMEEWLVRLASMSIEERCALPGLDRGRADVIVAGSLILIEVTRALGHQSVQVSTRGLRYGVILDQSKYLRFMGSL